MCSPSPCKHCQSPHLPGKNTRGNEIRVQIHSCVAGQDKTHLVANDCSAALLKHRNPTSKHIVSPRPSLAPSPGPRTQQHPGCTMAFRPHVLCDSSIRKADYRNTHYTGVGGRSCREHGFVESKRDYPLHHYLQQALGKQHDLVFKTPHQEHGGLGFPPSSARQEGINPWCLYMWAVMVLPGHTMSRTTLTFRGELWEHENKHPPKAKRLLHQSTSSFPSIYGTSPVHL